MGLSGRRALRPVPQEEEEDCKPLKRCHLTFQHRDLLMHGQAASLFCLVRVMNSSRDLLESNVVTGFYDTGMSFSFAAQVTSVMHGLGVGVGMYVGGFLLFTLGIY